MFLQRTKISTVSLRRLGIREATSNDANSERAIKAAILTLIEENHAFNDNASLFQQIFTM